MDMIDMMDVMNILVPMATGYCIRWFQEIYSTLDMDDELE